MGKLLLLAAFLAATPLAAQEARNATLAFSTNLTYLAFTAITISPTRATIIFPVECQIALSDTLALHPSMGTIWSANFSGGAQSALFEVECNVAWRPEGRRLAGWYLCAGPGVAISNSSTHLIVVANAECGYQWILGKGILLGIGGGGRIVIDATAAEYDPLPDLKLRLGWAF